MATLIPPESYPSRWTATSDDLERFMDEVIRQTLALNRSLIRLEERFDYDQAALEEKWPGINSKFREYNDWVQQLNTAYSDGIDAVLVGPGFVDRWHGWANQLNNWATVFEPYGVTSDRATTQPKPDGWTTGTWLTVIGVSVGGYFLLRWIWRRYLQPTGVARDSLGDIRYHRITPREPRGRRRDTSGLALRVRK